MSLCPSVHPIFTILWPYSPLCFWGIRSYLTFCWSFNVKIQLQVVKLPFHKGNLNSLLRKKLFSAWKLDEKTKKEINIPIRIRVYWHGVKMFLFIDFTARAVLIYHACVMAISSHFSGHQNWAMNACFFYTSIEMKIITSYTVKLPNLEHWS